MFMHGQEGVARDALIGAARRERSFSDFAESGLISGLGTYSTPCALEALARGSFLDLLRSRISPHTHIGLQLSIPIQQQIDDEMATHCLGLTGMILMASAVLSLVERMRPDFIPAPDYFPPGHFISPLGEDSLPVAMLFHRFVAGRSDGRALLGGHFLWKCASILGAYVESPDSFPDGGETLLTFQGRSRLRSTAVVADLRRFHRPAGSLAHFLRLYPGSFPRTRILPGMLGLGSDPNHDGHFSSLVRFASPFGGRCLH